jgi:hypothetical protein
VNDLLLARATFEAAVKRWPGAKITLRNGARIIAAVHESVPGTKLPIPNVGSSVANGGKADKICSMRVLRILTRSRHRPDRNPAAQQSPA